MIPRSRLDIPAFLLGLGLSGHGVEVGTQVGTYAAELLTTWPGVLHCVDPWRHDPAWRDSVNCSQPDMDARCVEATSRLRPWIDAGRCVIWRMTSVAAVALLPPDLAFVYLDARHDYASVTADLEAWAPRLQPGGVLCGHDYLDVANGYTDFGVRRAVGDWCGRHGYPVAEVIVTEEGFPSWLLVTRGGEQRRSETFAGPRVATVDGMPTANRTQTHPKPDRRSVDADAALERALLAGALPDADRRAPERPAVPPQPSDASEQLYRDNAKSSRT